MKNSIIKILAVVVFATLAVTSSFAQVTASATATATIVTPIAISKTVDMNFGNVAASAIAGTVKLATDGTRIPSGGVTLPATQGTVAAASFHVTGTGSYTYSIIVPLTDYTITRATGTETMTVNAFISDPDVATGGALTAGTQTLLVGATLNVGIGQVAGTYTNATGFDVTVNYN